MADTAKLLSEISDDLLLAALKERMASPEFAAKVISAQGERTRVEGALGRPEDATPVPTFSPEIQAQLEAAETLFNKDFLGPKQFEIAWGFAPSYVPAIPFSAELMAAAKNAGMMLRLAVDKTPDGSPMTMKAMNTMQAEKGKNPKVLYNTNWYKDKAFFEEAPRMGWRLESKAVLKDSTGKNEVEQLELIARHLQEVLFRGTTMLAHYNEAIAQFKSRKAHIKTLMHSNDWRKASTMIEALDLSQLTRATPVEMIQAIETQHHNNEDRAFLYPKTYVRTPRRNSDGYLVDVGGSDAKGTFVGCLEPGDCSGFRLGGIGVTLSLKS